MAAKCRRDIRGISLSRGEKRNYEGDIRDNTNLN